MKCVKRDQNPNIMRRLYTSFVSLYINVLYLQFTTLLLPNYIRVRVCKASVLKNAVN